MGVVAALLAALVICLCVVLPVVAIVRTAKIRRLELRIAGVEAALMRLLEQKAPLDRQAPLEQKAPPAPVHPAPSAISVEPVAATVAPPVPIAAPALEPFPPAASPPPPPPPPPAVAAPPQHLETVIGQKWLGWVAVLLIFGAAAFFLKYAFENRWIGELGRVTLGVAAGLVFAWSGLERHRKGWRYLSQVLTGGGITILYLSVYAAFGYYHLVDQRAAFIFLAILVAEAHLLALVYNARAIAVMALVGGFLVPRSAQHRPRQYRRALHLHRGCSTWACSASWWSRRLALDRVAGLRRHATACSGCWYSEHYHPEKRVAAILFQTAIFLLFCSPTWRLTCARPPPDGRSGFAWR